MHGRYIDGSALRTIREQRGISRQKLHELSGVALSWLKAIESDGRQPSGIKAWAIARALDVDIGTFSYPLESEAEAA